MLNNIRTWVRHHTICAALGHGCFDELFFATSNYRLPYAIFQCTGCGYRWAEIDPLRTNAHTQDELQRALVETKEREVLVRVMEDAYNINQGRFSDLHYPRLWNVVLPRLNVEVEVGEPKL